MYQLVAWEETRKKILSMEKMIKLVLKSTNSQDNRIIFVALNFLEVVQIFEPNWSEKVKKKKFNVYNREFVSYVRLLDNVVDAQGDQLDLEAYHQDLYDADEMV